MPERTSHPHGTPSWVDLSTTDPVAAKAFYGDLFGWTWDDQALPDSDDVYAMAQKGGRAVAAIAGQQPDMAAAGVPPMWNTYVTVDDLEAAVDRVAGAGGTVVAPPFDVMDAGRMAVAVDPGGAMFMLWSPKGSIGAELVGEPGTYSWSELVTPDLAGAAAFYAEVFGWSAETFGDYQMFRRDDGADIAGSMNPVTDGVPTHWGVYFAVEDCDATVAAARAAGGAVFNGPLDVEPGRIATVADPQQAWFNIIHVNEPGA